MLDSANVPEAWRLLAFAAAVALLVAAGWI